MPVSARRQDAEFALPEVESKHEDGSIIGAASRDPFDDRSACVGRLSCRRARWAARISTRVCPSSRRRRSGSHIDALRSSSLGGRPSHSAAAPHMRTCQTPSRWRSSPVRACPLAWCYQRPHQRPLAVAPERRDVRRSCPPGRTSLLLRLVAALRGSPSSLAGLQAIGQEWEPTCAPRRVRTHKPGPSSELRAPSSELRALRVGGLRSASLWLHRQTHGDRNGTGSPLDRISTDKASARFQV